jgi:hypothetical protein
MAQEKERDHLKNAQLIIDTQAAEIRRLRALIGTVPVDEGPRIERLEQALRGQVATAQAHEKESCERLATINRVRKVTDTWVSNGLGRFAAEIRKALRNVSRLSKHIRESWQITTQDAGSSRTIDTQTRVREYIREGIG